MRKPNTKKMQAECDAFNARNQIGSDVLGAWVRSAERLPMPQESISGYFWCWDERAPEEAPALLEAWERDGTPMGFCHEACGVVSGISHWIPATPPSSPNAALRGDSGLIAGVPLESTVMQQEVAK
jgi:hypothetical protein